MNTPELHFNAPPEARDEEPTAQQIMTSSVVAITAESDLLVASRLMAEHAVRHLPVMEGERCCGLLLEIDVVQALALAENPLVCAPLLAGELCRPAPILHRSDARSVAARRMRDAGIDAAVVTANGAVVGIVTATDLIQSLAAETGG